MTQFDERVAALSPEKRALLERLLRERGEDVFPLSVAQQGIWFLEQLRPGNPGYVVRAAVRVRGELDVRVLRAAVEEIVRRHEALRTVFRTRDGKPVQVVRDGLALDLRQQEATWSGEQDLPRHVAEALKDPFDLAEGPLLRLRLLRVSAREHVLAVAMHHLISDGWSVTVFLAELSALYEAYAAGRPSPLPPLAIQYGDFAVWQRRRDDENLATGLARWRRELAGAPDALPLPTDRPRPAVQGFNGASVAFELPAEVVRDLDRTAKQQGATTYMALLAVFHLLLRRYSGADDVVVGVPLANRERAEVEPLIGFFVNTLPVRARLGGNPSFRTVIDRVRQACLGAYAHQDIPFEKIVADLRLDRDLSRPPIFQTAFSYQNDPLSTVTVAGLELDRIPLPAEGARFDLEVQSFDHAGAVRGWFEYDRDLFDEPIIARMAAHFRRLAELVAASPDTPVERLDLLDDDERRTALADARGPVRVWPTPDRNAGWVHEQVAWWARHTPDAVAVRFEGESLGYVELDRRAARLARRLRRMGAGPGTLVGVAVPRSAELVVSLLAVLKAGAAYVPLDTDLPQARLAYMIQDAAVQALLTRRDVLKRLPPTAAEPLCVDDLNLDADLDVDPDVVVDGEDLAYMIYTSGSTGRPKGVMNVHAAIRNRLLWMQDQYHLTPADRVLQKTPVSFDVSVWEFFWPLMTGATLVVAKPGGHRDPRYLIDLIRREQITTLHFVPSMLQVFLREPGVEECTSLRRVICSGEALSRELQERLFARSTAELHNLYGPTEAAVDVTYWPCRRDGDPRPVPIGFPIANTQIYVLDERLRPVPKGVAGELHIGGRNLARGYLNRPDLTADRFVPNPFGAGDRLYRTGDLARVREDGAIEYLGRLDHQVKLRGFRIEPGEIESVLTSHPRVSEAIVVAREPRPGDVRLVAYLTGDGEPPDVADLRDHLRERLPEYMVPAAFVVLPELPLTANGKADRAALPEPDLSRPETRTAFVAPRDDLERVIADIWRDVLGVDRVGVHDNFFDLGGHSLLMPELKARLTETAGREVSLIELFQYPTVGALAGALTGPAAGSATGGRDRADLRRRSQARRRPTRRSGDEG
ncbi:amino acid adenylation domain-containing protein [Thermopolyspora sp. NPDC052614]|uniref:amino acid adenylation domain-containing protein n=1 Tax=Thermopolyspora sp. NPDC052614 TaxID=3155682 RepID=UPI00342637CA